MIKFSRVTDSNDQTSDVIISSDNIVSGRLTGGTTYNINVPDGAKYVLFASNGSFYFKNGSNVEIPNVLGNSDAELNPTGRAIKADVISIASINDIHISISFYK